MSHMEQQRKKQNQNKQANLKDQLKAETPNSEVEVVASRRKFSQSYKVRIVTEAEQCSDSGEIGSLLRREGLYTSHLSRWRQAQQQGKLESGPEAKRGPKVDVQAAEVIRLKKESVRLKQELEQVQLVVDIQKKVSQLLGLKVTMEVEQR